MSRALSAGGKLFVSGEYAVLWGGTARLLGVGPRVHALVRPRDDRRVQVLLEGGRLEGESTPAGVRWSEPISAPFHFVARTLDLAFRAVATESRGLTVAFESSPLVEGHKLGLGSSARATVLAAEAARVALQASYDSLKLALVSHADAQGGKGSGGDVAASFAGGFSRYRMPVLTPLLEAATQGRLHGALLGSAPIELSRLGEPVFPMLYAFSGQSASTTALVKEAERRSSRTDRARFVEQSDHAGARLERGLLRGDFADVEEGVETLQALLWSLGSTRHEGLTRIIELARAFGSVAKQSGAGGGDGAIVFSKDLEGQAALLEALKLRNLYAVAIAPEAGLRGEAGGAPALAGWLDAD